MKKLLYFVLGYCKHSETGEDQIINNTKTYWTFKYTTWCWYHSRVHNLNRMYIWEYRRANQSHVCTIGLYQYRRNYRIPMLQYHSSSLIQKLKRDIW